KMLFAMTNDVRVILIKLADRLHNLRTLQYLPPVKQKYVAKETLEIYAPLAHRLGINKIKSQLEELSFQILQPDQYKEISEFLVKQGLEGDAKLQEALHQIDKHLREVHIHADLSGRPKQIFSIWGKMQKHNLTLEGLYDFLGVRILTKSVKDCYGALGIVHKFWKPIPGRFKDYIAVPKPNMYQSLHTTVIYDGRPLEVQIRTEEMHRISEEGIAAHWDYKESSGKEATPDYKEKLSWLRNLIDWYQDAKDASEFMETVKVELFQYHVYVFTPKGDVVELPKGSTPVDFGYHIHTDVGHRCIGAKVNGHIVPLEYSLQNGDIVSIITSKIQKGPSRDWLKFVQSTNAKKKIRAWLKKEFREEFVGNGEKEFLETLSRMGGTKEEEKKIKLPAFVEEIKNIGFPNLDELYAGIGAGEVRAQQVIGKLFPDLVPRQAPPVVPSAQQPQRKPDREHRRKARKGPRIIAGGIESAEVKISRCCNPIPGDPIMGYITRGRGVTVHRTDCPNAKELYKQPEGRLIDVRWDMGVQVEQVDQSYRTRMRVETTDRPGMLNAVTSVISNQGVNIYSANARTTKQRTGVLDFSIEVANAQQLQALIRALLRVNGVTKVFRSDSPSSKDEA
ncbi:MAG TPA: bifunctional (p)ppGpp synthetase/guanosine-3',5'-bis(diphosphate) 3'-pyrophosphohydrolase, partial [Candidatus Ozemobacteraceae bacterium]|nr:bifunctional (p)ppGpp synthetase/guanosine-3',5'-bis(diphosphate) 3'-pyrophosphohydrolase [Candidatus Ozemobacteraceae bacterium]